MIRLRLHHVFARLSQYVLDIGSWIYWLGEKVGSMLRGFAHGSAACSDIVRLEYTCVSLLLLVLAVDSKTTLRAVQY